LSRLPLILFLAAPLTLGAQETVTLDQSLGFSYKGSQASLGAQSASDTTTQAYYQFELGMPILAYRLGAMSIGGGVGYLKQSNEYASDSALGLNTFGVSGSLFPYQPYHLSFDFSQTKALDLFDGGSNSGQTFGLGLTYRGYRIQNLQVAYRHGRVNGIGGGGNYSSLSVSDNERRGATDIHFAADRQEATFGLGSTWRSTTMTINAQTKLKGPWSLTNSLSTIVYQGATFLQAGASLMGAFGPWATMSALDTSFNKSESQTLRSAGLSQSIARSWGRFSAFSQVGISGGSSSQDSASSATMGNLILGGSYKLTSEWTLMGDVSGGWSGAKAGAGSSANAPGATRSLHVGMSWGGGMPELLRQAMFYWSNLRFQRRLEEDYPPDYLPPEMAKVQMRRRLEQHGSMQFSTDLYRVQNGGPGHQDWFRVQGGLSFPNGLMVQTIGDLRKDNRFSNPELSLQNTHLTLHGAYGLGKTSLTFGMGYSKSSVTEGTPLQPSVNLPQAGSNTARTTLYYSLGANSFVAGIPVGVTLLRNNDAMGLGTTSLLTYFSNSFGKTSFNVNLQRGWRTDGLRTSQVTVNIGRWFDTIPLWGFGK
jgi:hypothetical protein